jgi:glycosyltransferase involved in cell wall biosynthesis
LLIRTSLILALINKVEKITAYIPSYNNEDTILKTFKSIQNQTHPVEQIFVIDDASKDFSVSKLKKAGVEIIQNKENLGRGSVRARAMEHAKYEKVLCVDAGKMIEPNFLEKILPWFEKKNIGAVFGSLAQYPPKNAAERWRGKYLYKENQDLAEIQYNPPLITFAAVLKKSIVLEVGDAKCKCLTLESCSAYSILARYWRWNAGEKNDISFSGYIKKINFSFKEMVINDLKDGDWGGALISALCPHYQFGRTILERFKS